MEHYNLQVYRLMLVREPDVALSVPLINKKLNTVEQAAQVFAEYLYDAPEEHFVTLYLDRKNKVIGIRTVAIGTLTRALVTPTCVFAGVCETGAVKIIVAHNHPSGETQPSDGDNDLTASLVSAGEILGIELIDHLIIGFDMHGEYSYFSYAQEKKL